MPSSPGPDPGMLLVIHGAHATGSADPGLEGPHWLVGPGISPQRCSCFLEDRSNQYSAKTLEGRRSETWVQPHQISRANFRGTSEPGGWQPRNAAGGVERRESSHT